jgi:hypothetical protein
MHSKQRNVPSSRMLRLLRISMRVACRFCLLLLAMSACLHAQEAGKQLTIREAVDHALQQSKLTVPGGSPFHLKAHIVAVGKPQLEYTADVEEYWVSPEKWRRTVRSKDFSQTLVANGDKLSETLTGDYYPFWLHDLVTAIFDPLPMAEQLKLKPGHLEIPEDSTKSSSCLNMESKVGIAPVENKVAYVFCFGGKLGLLKAAVTPGYRAQFADYLPFKKKLVARSITATFAPGLTISAKITELAEMASPNESKFSIDKATPAAEQMKSSHVGEDSARVLALDTPAIAWPAVHGGPSSGVLSLYISTDRSGQVREAWPVGPSNPEMSEAARQQVLRWRYKPYLNEAASQMEAVLTFAFTAGAAHTRDRHSCCSARTRNPHRSTGSLAPGMRDNRFRFLE